MTAGPSRKQPHAPDRPNHPDRPLILGLTGSIGMGKSETARMFADLGVPVFDADASVQALQAPGGRALAAIGAMFPGTVTDGVLDRRKLGAAVFADRDALRRLEALMHPMVAEDRRVFLRAAADSGAALVVFDVPLLFETGGDKGCDHVLVVSAPAAVQRTRVLARSGMTEEKFADIVKTQMPDADKRARADFIIETDRGLDHARARVRAIVRQLTGDATP
ncbi:dephospho-CoA kinase [Eilatimonas milleporae]|uniref:Dephospho-CoA kinase n=1 Tax=Eilatimonas milleporae TaxID=911205 RepID=A0A3M0BZ20_9PROT|nr:dephospho-CoA kinase [Eilatimonas milleporae]RMB01835.1 dephospho-CoA kinase [Eilatimonas milleporae]